MAVHVAIRVRHRTSEAPSAEDVAVVPLPHTKQLLLGNTSYSADYVFTPDYTQGYFYDACVAPKINHLIEGTDVTIIAYGKSNSGKTYTIFGPSSICYFNEPQHGVVPRATRHVFNALSRLQQQGGVHFKVYVSCFEVANHNVSDLLANGQQQRGFILTPTEKGSAFLSGVETVPCQNVNEVLNCVKLGMRYRQTVWTNHNTHSSRSHCFFILTIHQHWYKEGRIEKKISKATFIDLGSSELTVYVGQNGAVAQDNAAVNGGLKALGDIVSTLPNDRWVIPQYTICEPLLTALLKDGFTVSTQTLLICCVSSPSTDYSDTTNHLNLISELRLRCGHEFDEAQIDANTTTSSQELVFENSENGSSQVDSFGLEFAASQWMKLVSNAEGLFQKLVQSGLSKDAREQVEQWLCLKQEYEECLVNDMASNFQGKSTRSLERIDEVTESEEKSSGEKSLSETELDSDSIGEEETVDEVSESKNGLPNFKKPDFHEKLEDLLDKLRAVTDKEIDRYIELTIEPVEEEGLPASPPKSMVRGSNNGRRKSILPGEMSLQIAGISREDPSSEVVHSPIKENFEEADNEQDNATISESSSKNLKINHLFSTSESKQSQIDLVILDLEAANKRIDELQQMIRIKEQFIEEMIQNSGTRSTAKARFQRKLAQLGEEYFKARANLAKAQKALNRGDNTVKGQVDKYKALTSRYEKRLHDLELIKQIAGDTAKKVIELETSLNSSKRKLQKFTKQLKHDEEHKLELELELIEDQRRIRELTEVNKAQFEKLRDSCVQEEKIKWIAEEEVRLQSLRESSEKLRDQLNEQQCMLEKRESFLKEKLSQEKNACKSIAIPSGRSSASAGPTTKESSSEDYSSDTESKEALRHEIRNLRKTRDCLVEQRRNLDAKLNKDKIFSPLDERKFLECDEAIEAIDSSIEYKNELMCGHKGIESCDVEREKGEKMLIDRLMKLSEPEMRCLLYKYFRKVIDLRESGRKMEQQIAEQDMQIEAQTWKVQALSNALQQANIESERRLVMVHREHQEKLHLMFRHYAGETSGGSSVDREAPSSGGDALQVQNKALKHRVLELETMLYSQKGSVHKGTSNALTIPQQNLKKLQGACSAPHTTKVTRQKNKLIIQQQKPKKNSK